MILPIDLGHIYKTLSLKTVYLVIMILDVRNHQLPFYSVIGVN